MQGYLEQIYDAFGPHRTFWGTDITKMPCSWKDCITMFTEEARWLDENDRALVMEMPSAHGGAGIEAILFKDNGKLIMALINTEKLPVAVIIGATSKWQSDGRNTLLARTCS